MQIFGAITIIMLAEFACPGTVKSLLPANLVASEVHVHMYWSNCACKNAYYYTQYTVVPYVPGQLAKLAS